jgi:hypothetical protein
LSVVYVTAKPANVTNGKSRGARAGYEARGQKHLNISFKLTAGNKSHKIKKGYQISNCKFRDREIMLVGI